MTSNIRQLAAEFESKLAKEARRGGTRMNAKKILKELDKNRKVYKDSRDKLRKLEADLAKIESEIQECRDLVRSSRSDILNKNEVLRNMDLADAKYAVFYDGDDQDVGYVINGEEHHFELDDTGEVRITPMKERRRQQRADKSDTEDSEHNNYEDDSSDADDGNFILHPHLRFID